MSLVAASIVALASLAGVALTILTLPGIWLTLAVALLCWWWMGADFYSAWTLAAALAMGIVAEVVELAASAAGAAKSGGGRSGAIGSIVGGVVGALAGSLILPIIGTIAGGVIGAGLGAIAGERGIAGKTWSHAARVGKGAMVARFIALCVKIAFAVAIGVTLTVAAFVP